MLKDLFKPKPKPEPVGARDVLQRLASGPLTALSTLGPWTLRESDERSIEFTTDADGSACDVLFTVLKFRRSGRGVLDVDVQLKVRNTEINAYLDSVRPAAPKTSRKPGNNDLVSVYASLNELMVVKDGVYRTSIDDNGSGLNIGDSRDLDAELSRLRQMLHTHGLPFLTAYRSVSGIHDLLNKPEYLKQRVVGGSSNTEWRACAGAAAAVLCKAPNAAAICDAYIELLRSWTDIETRYLPTLQRIREDALKA